MFTEREGSPRDVDGAALQDARNAPTPVPDDLHQETDLNVGEGDQAAVGYDVGYGNMELMSENSVLAQGILLRPRKEVNVTPIFFSFFCRGACNNASVLDGLNHHIQTPYIVVNKILLWYQNG